MKQKRIIFSLMLAAVFGLSTVGVASAACPSTTPCGGNGISTPTEITKTSAGKIDVKAMIASIKAQSQTVKTNVASVRANVSKPCGSSGTVASGNTTTPCNSKPCNTATGNSTPCNTGNGSTPCGSTPCNSTPCNTTGNATSPCGATPCATAPCNTAPSAPAPVNTGTTDTAASLSAIESQIHSLINDYRKANGLRELTANSKISDVARGHSSDMASGKVAFGHDGFSDRVASIKSQVGGSSFAENVAWNNNANSAQTAFNGWINSAGHKKNILGDYSSTGIGVTRNSNGSYYFTQIFVK